MAGAKGKSGGARPGAGRKKSEPQMLDDSDLPITDDPRVFLRAVMNNPGAEARHRIDAAKALMPFEHQKLGEGGKKDQKQQNAEKVASRFAQAAPPKLVAAGGKKV